MCPELTSSVVTMDTPNFDNAFPHCITYNNRSQPPHDCFLTHWSPGESGCDIQKAFYILFFLLVSSDFPLIVPSHECHWALFMLSHYCFRNDVVPSSNKPLPPLLPEPMLTPIYAATWCFYSAGWVILKLITPDLRPRQNGCHFADGMLKYIFLIEIKITFD